MFMSSARVWQEMQYEPSGFWPVPINNGDEFALLTKVPAHVIKAAFRGCPLILNITTAKTSAGTVISTVLAIHDDPVSPMGITGVHRHPEEQLALDRIMEADNVLFVFFDELSRPVLRATCAIDPTSRDSAKALLQQAGNCYCGAWSSMLGEVLDEVQALVDPTQTAVSVFAPTCVPVPLKLSDFQSNAITAVGEHEALDFQLEDPNEGYVFEQGTWHLLEHLFAGAIFHAPQVGKAPDLQELTDVFAYSEVGLCFVETKAMAVLSTALDRTTERRARNIEKQIDKALGQLPGAMRSVRQGLSLTAKTGAPIVLPPNAGPFRHGIVMVSEMMPALDWDSITAQLLSLSDDTTMFHVLDLQELRLLVGISRNDPIQFMAYLLYRHERVRENGSAFLRMKLDGPPLP